MTPGPLGSAAFRDPYDPDTVAVGVIGRPHGLRGDLMLRPFNPSGDALDAAESLILEQGGARREMAIAGLRPADQSWILGFEGIGDRDAAAKLTGALVRMRRADMPPLDPGEFYVEDVVGCAVVAEDGGELGVCTGTFWNGAHDVMTVIDEGTSRERLIALVPDFVLSVDVPGRKIQVRWDDDDDQ